MWPEWVRVRSDPLLVQGVQTLDSGSTELLRGVGASLAA